MFSVVGSFHNDRVLLVYPFCSLQTLVDTISYWVCKWLWLTWRVCPTFTVQRNSSHLQRVFDEQTLHGKYPETQPEGGVITTQLSFQPSLSPWKQPLVLLKTSLLLTVNSAQRGLSWVAKLPFKSPYLSFLDAVACYK